MLKTAVVQIGNSDNKLTQDEWHNFVEKVHINIDIWAEKSHFFGGSPNWARWQNVSWVFEIEEKNTPALKKILCNLKEPFKQESIAWLEGDILFI